MCVLTFLHGMLSAGVLLPFGQSKGLFICYGNLCEWVLAFLYYVMFFQHILFKLIVLKTEIIVP
jgi:hypothetical protein